VPQLTKNQEYCSIARGLAVLGERWTLLIVRDLLSGPKRFGELEKLVVGITPKWLTVRLRSLEAASLVERVGGRYQLTTEGEGLRPVMEELSLWSATFDSRAPEPDEVIVPAHDMWALEVYLNRRVAGWTAPTTWAIDLGEGEAHTMTFDGTRWTWIKGDSAAPDVRVATTKEAWSTLLANAQALRPTKNARIDVTGDPDSVREFRALAGIG